MEIWKGSWELEKLNVTHIQEGGYGEWQAGQPHLNPWEDDGKKDPGKYFRCMKDEMIWSNQHRYKKKKLCLTNMR